MTAAPEYYAELYAAHAPEAHRIALAMVPPADAEDLVQDAFTRIMRSGTRPVLVGPYLRAAVRNGAADYARRRLRAVPDPDPQPPPAPPAEVLAMATDEQRMAARAFAALPERWRRVLWETEVEGIPPRRLVPHLGRSANAVAQLAARAREGLRRAYLAEHIGAGIALTCRPHAAALPALARGTLAPRARDELAAHLATCAGCAVLASELESVSARLGELLAPGAVAAGGTSLLARLLHAGPSALRHPLTAGTLATMASAAAVVTLTVTAPHPGQHAPAGPAVPGASAPGRPGATQAPGAGSPGDPVLADVPVPVPTQLPGGQLPGGSLPGGQLPGGPAPGGLLPGGSLPGGQLPGTGPAPGPSVEVGVNQPAGAQGAQLAGPMQPAAGGSAQLPSPAPDQS